jgi:GTP-binding protein YchF
MQTLTKRKERAVKQLRNQAEKKEAELVLAVLEKIGPALENAQSVRSVNLTSEEKAAIYDCHFITAKPQLYVCNVDEDGIKSGNAYIETVKKRAESEGAKTVCIYGKFEAELAGLEDPQDKIAFIEDLGLKEPGLHSLIHSTYELLGLRTFFSKNEDECRAWTIRAGYTAPKAAGVIHTEFEKGFIKADVYSFDDIEKYGTEAKIKEAGKFRLEGRDYIVKDGDVMFFKFNN